MVSRESKTRWGKIHFLKWQWNSYPRAKDFFNSLFPRFSFSDVFSMRKELFLFLENICMQVLILAFDFLKDQFISEIFSSILVKLNDFGEKLYVFHPMWRRYQIRGVVGVLVVREFLLRKSNFLYFVTFIILQVRDIIRLTKKLLVWLS